MPLTRLLVYGAFLCALLCPALTPAAAAAAPAACGFALGFATLHDLIPDVVGDCVANAAPQPDGDVQQPTVNGMLVWRKADNWTAFTDGAMTWINGPCGLQSRPNTLVFPWETGATCTQSRFASFVGTWEAPNTLLVVFDSGYARFRWKSGPCAPGGSGYGSPRCAQSAGGLESRDEHAELQLPDASFTPLPTASAAVLTSTSRSVLAQGNVSLTVLADGLLQIQQDRGVTAYVCQAPRDPGTCQP